MENYWVTGLTGVVTRKVRHAGIAGMTRDLNPGDPWTIRWDFDEVKGSHVNFEFGKYPQAKICFKAPVPQHEAPSLFYLDIIRDQTTSSGYRHYSASGTPAERNHGMVNTGPGGSGSRHVMTAEERKVSEQKQMHESAKQLARHWTSPILVARGEK
ncbi:hypothetical protein DL98DRAFT_581705 [Cadophora sp. DSE1049]|nr:hypothetical protein DL98DRAFT_581705 [Cadophora sp. DSE1049]